jgi:hypothetical protein
MLLPVLLDNHRAMNLREKHPGTHFGFNPFRLLFK